jgi:hypothetical protein
MAIMSTFAWVVLGLFASAVSAREWVDMTEDVLVRADALLTPPSRVLTNDPIIGENPLPSP